MKSVFQVRRVLKNQVFEMIERRNLQPAEFMWEPIDDKGNGERLLHRPTGFYFTFEVSSEKFWSTWRPPFSNAERSDVLSGESQQLQVVDRWLGLIQADVEAPDLWGAVARESELMSDDAAEGNRFFTASEQRLLAGRIAQLERQIEALAPNTTPDEKIHVHESLGHAKDAATRLTRKDWKALFVGKLVDIIIRLALEPRKAQALLHFATMYIGPLLARAQELLS